MSRDRVYSSPQNIDYFLDIKPTYTHGPEHHAAQDPSHAKADDSNPELVFTGTALTDSLEHASAQDLSQGGAIDNELEDIRTPTTFSISSQPTLTVLSPVLPRIRLRPRLTTPTPN